MRLEEKVALVTGAASGIGFAVAELFDCEGAIVVASDVKPPDQPYPGTSEAMTHGVTSEEPWASVIAAIVKKHDRLDVLINNGNYCL